VASELPGVVRTNVGAAVGSGEISSGKRTMPVDGLGFRFWAALPGLLPDLLADLLEEPRPTSSADLGAQASSESLSIPPWRRVVEELELGRSKESRPLNEEPKLDFGVEPAFGVPFGLGASAPTLMTLGLLFSRTETSSGRRVMLFCRFAALLPGRVPEAEPGLEPAPGFSHG